MGYVLGIDVGTTFTAAAVWRAGQPRPEAVPLGDQATAIPSVLLVRSDGALLVGDAANRRALTEPGRVAREFKRRVGDRVPLMVGGEAFLPHTLVAMLLRRVIDQVAEQEGERPAKVVVACPANWGEYRRQLLTDAAAEAGAGDVALVSEPVAAAVWYASQERLADGALVAVYDLGGGTFDAAVLRTAGDGFELLGEPAGDDSLGGIDFDQVVIDHLAATIGPAWTALDLSEPATLRAVAQVRAHAVAAKEALSSDLEVEIPVIVPGVSREVRLTRAEFEDGIREQLDQTVTTLRRALADARVRPQDLHAVLLVGGSSRIPLVSGLIAAEVGAPVAVDTHPKLAVALGAATVAAPRSALAPVPVPVPTEGEEPEAAAAEPVAGGGGGDPERGGADEDAAWAAPEEAAEAREAATVAVGPPVAAAGPRRRKPARGRAGILAAVAAALFATAVIVPLTMTRGATPASVGPGDTTEQAGSSVGQVADTTILASGGTATTPASGSTTTVDGTQAGGGDGTTSTTRRRTTTTRRQPGGGGSGGTTTSQSGGGGGGTAPTTVPQTSGPPTFGLTVTMSRTDLPVRIISEPGGIDCPGRCSARFPPGTGIVLRPHVGFGFSARMFGGPCGGRVGACSLTLNGPLTIRVEPFAEIS
jgi:actin-like ATPase involved in cell morphogenesis